MCFFCVCTQDFQTDNPSVKAGVGADVKNGCPLLAKPLSYISASQLDTLTQLLTRKLQKTYSLLF